MLDKLARLVTAFLIILFHNSCVVQSQDIPMFFKGSEVLDNPYGVCAHVDLEGFDGQFIDKEFRMLKTLGINNVRVDFRWSIIRNTLDQKIEKYDHLDLVMKKARQYDINILPILGYTLNDGTKPWVEKTAWASYLRSIHRRYGDLIHNWELWNEQNLQQVSPIDYCQLAVQTKTQLGLLNPGDKLLFGGLGGIDIDYLNSLVKQDSNVFSNFHIMNLHYYVHDGGPEWLIEQVFPKLQKFMSDTNISDMSVWMTETGNSTYNLKRGWPKRDYACSEEEQAEWLARDILICLAAGMDKVYYYQLRAYEKDSVGGENHFGLLHKDLDPKPALAAYKQLIKMCPSGSKRPTLKRKGEVYVCSWETSLGMPVTAFWTRKELVPIKIKARKEAICYDLYGKKIKLRKVRMASSQLYYVVGNVVVEN